jgi:hypothetical protein
LSDGGAEDVEFEIDDEVDGARPERQKLRFGERFGDDGGALVRGRIAECW